MEKRDGGGQRNSDAVHEPSGQRMSDEEEELEELEEREDDEKEEKEQVSGVGQSVRFFTHVNPSVKQIWKEGGHVILLIKGSLRSKLINIGEGQSEAFVLHRGIG